jgi:hypothetical protein
VLVCVLLCTSLLCDVVLSMRCAVLCYYGLTIVVLVCLYGCPLLCDVMCFALHCPAYVCMYICGV